MIDMLPPEIVVDIIYTLCQVVDLENRLENRDRSPPSKRRHLKPAALNAALVFSRWHEIVLDHMDAILT